MAGFILEYQDKNGGLVILDGDYVKYWKATGLPDYEGGTEGFAELFPSVVKEMVDRRIIKKID